MSAPRPVCIAVAALLGGCAAEARPPTNVPPSPKGHDEVAFVQGDYDDALARARAAHHPLVAVACAAWSTDCLALRAYVFRAPAMLAKEAAYTWLWIDVDRDVAVLDHMGAVDVSHVPAITEIDPASERAVRAWPIDEAALHPGRAPKTPLERRVAEDPVALANLASTGAPEIEAALPILERDARDFPDDWVPPMRIARAYAKLGRYYAARGAAERALARAEGWSKVVVLALDASIDRGMHDDAAAKRSLEAALELARAMPLAGERAAFRAELEARLGELQDER